MADIGERPLGNGNPQSVQGASGAGVNFALHLFGKGFLTIDRPAMEIGRLPKVSSFEITQALGAELARRTGRLQPLELGGQESL